MKKELVRKVTVVEHCNKIEVYFEYHPKTVDIVKKIGSGRYIEYPRKHWIFPNNVRQTLLQTFRLNGYYIELLHVFPGEPNIVSMLYTCKKCRRQNMVGRDGLCAKCRAQSN